MNKIILRLAVVFIACICCHHAHAANLNGNTSAEVRSPLVITERVAMDFGTIAVDSIGEAVRLRPNNNITFTNSSISLGGQTSARFRVEGTPNASVSYNFSTGDLLSGPGADIPIGNFVLNRSNPFTINGSGRRNFRVGATMFPSAGQLGGVYSGTYILTINYE